ncbi:MAG: NAD(P)H-binding protein [Filimonas sp.]|nr:NAD(P)H-binding protein [Filimonas sp.]
MTITVFGATGQVGKRILKLALAQDYTVRAFARDISTLYVEAEHNKNLQPIQGYVFNEQEVFDAINGADAVLSVLGGSFDGQDKARSLGIKNIIAQMKKAGLKRIIALGGFGVLSAPNGDFLIDQPGYPEQYLPVGREHLQAYLYLRDSGLDYTFVCSPDIVNAEETGKYISRATYPPEPNNGNIHAGDIAQFMLKELKDNSYVKQKVGLSSL